MVIKTTAIVILSLIFFSLSGMEIYDAIQQGKTKQVKAVLDAGVSCSTNIRELAFLYGHMRIVKLLLACNFDAHNYAKKSFLPVNLRLRHDEITKMFLMRRVQRWRRD